VNFLNVQVLLNNSAYTSSAKTGVLVTEIA